LGDRCRPSSPPPDESGAPRSPRRSCVGTCACSGLMCGWRLSIALRQDSSDDEEDDEEDAGGSPSPQARRSPSPVCTHSKCIKGEGCIRKGSALETCGLCKTMSVHSACMPGFRRFGKFMHLYSHCRTVVLCFACASNVVNVAMRDVQREARGKGNRITPSQATKRRAASSGGGSTAKRWK
jgi:hypothetical protein